MEGVLLLVAATLVGIGIVGAAAARGQVGTIEEYVAARDSAGTGALTATIVASSMGAWILFSPAEAGVAFGGVTAVFGYAIGSALPLVGYAWLGPRIRRLIPEGHSLTEYAYVRYGPAMYAYVLLVSVAYMFVFLAAEFTGVAGALSAVAGIPGWQTALLVGAVVFAYTAYGGLRASIATDVVQAVLILPLLFGATVAAFVALGGVSVVREAAAAEPQLLSLGYLPGVKFGIYVAVAILGAELLNQSWWQRIYAARDESTLRRSFVGGAALVIPMILAMGLFGPLAVGLGVVPDGQASVALFLVVTEALPEWFAVAFALLAALLIASSADTLMNAIASLVAVDLPRVLPGTVETDQLTTVARGFTGVVALAATVIGAQGYSVLVLFLLADLLAAATFVPLFLGLFAARAPARGMLLASLTGLAVGLAVFPPARGVLPGGALPAPSFFWSFLGAAGVSAAVAAATTALSEERYDLDRLSRDITRLDRPSDGGGAGPAVVDGGTESER